MEASVSSQRKRQRAHRNDNAVDWESLQASAGKESLSVLNEVPHVTDRPSMDSATFWNSFAAESRKRRHRPLPSSQALIATVDARGLSRSPCPLIRDFLASLGRVPSTPTSTSADTQGSVGDKPEDETANQPLLHAVDDATKSTMTPGQHQRLRQLQAKGASLSRQQLGELQKLRKLLIGEQRVYEKAVLEFWKSAADRVFLGLTDDRSKAHAFVQRFWSGGLLASTVVAGKCRQIISVQPEHSFSPERCEHELVGGPTPQGAVCKLPDDGQEIALPSRPPRSHLPLHSDKQALQLAKTHNATLITSIETLEVLLQEPADSDWTLPYFCDGETYEIPILDAPLVHSVKTPRLCLEKAFRLGMTEWLESTSIQQAQQPTSGCPQSFIYILLVVPVLKQRSQRILVRRPRGLTDHSGQSLLLHSRIEYFPERGREQPSPSEKALWILDHVLQPTSHVVVGSIDPLRCTILRWDHVSLAHGLVHIPGPFGRSETSALKHWSRLMHILLALQTIGRGQYVLSYPGQGISVPESGISVHLATPSIESMHREGQPSISPLAMNEKAVERAIRPWEWKADRMEYTFPIDNGQA